MQRSIAMAIPLLKVGLLFKKAFDVINRVLSRSVDKVLSA